MKRFALIGLFIIFIVGLWGTGANAKTFVLSTDATWAGIPTTGVTPDSGGASPFVVNHKAGTYNISGMDDQYCAACVEISAVTFAQGVRGHTDASNSIAGATPFNVYWKGTNKVNPTSAEWTDKGKSWIWRDMTMDSQVSPFQRCVKIPPLQTVRFYVDHVSGASPFEFMELNVSMAELPSNWKEEPLSLGYTESPFDVAGNTNFVTAAPWINGAWCIELQPVNGNIWYTPDGRFTSGTTPTVLSKEIPDTTVEQITAEQYINGIFSQGSAAGTLNIEQFTICPER